MANDLSTSSKQVLEFKGSGQLQNQRALPALSRQPFQVEQRTFSQWIAYLREMGNHIQFFDIATKAASGTWASALPDDDAAMGLQNLMQGKPVSAEIKALANRPDIASLMSYYHMLRYPIAQFQRFSSRHLDYYYQDVLGFKTKPAKPDRAHLVLTLADDAKPITLMKGEQFDGGKDSEGNSLVYEMTSNAQFNHAHVDRVLSIARLNEGGRLLLTNAVDGAEDLEMPEAGMFSFGEKDKQEAGQPLAERQSEPEQGVELSSPCLYLSGGIRTLCLDFDVSDVVTLPGALSALFDLFISTQEGFVALNDSTDNATLNWQDNKLTLELDALFAPITVPEEQTHITQPTLRLLLKKAWLENDATGNLRRGVFNAIGLNVSVQGLPGARLGHAGGILDGEAPFTPFGASPRVASRFDFTHPELLCKPIENASLGFSWLDRPNDWDEHYYAYKLYDQSVQPVSPVSPNKGEGEDEGKGGSEGKNINGSEGERADAPMPEQASDPALDPEFKLAPLKPFHVKVFQSDKIGALTFDHNTHLFSQNLPVNNIDEHGFEFVVERQESVADHTQLPLSENHPTAWPKYFSLQLESPDFKHGQYALVNQFAGQQNARNFEDESYSPLLVMPPYTPVLDSFTLNYQANAHFSIAQADAMEVRHIHPLGRPSVTADAGRFSALPRLDLRGYLYIGVSKVKLPGQVRLYFQLDPVDSSNIVDDPRIDWHYLTNDGWQYFDSSSDGSARITEDSTFQLLDSGIITFELPELNYDKNFIDGDKLWIRIGVAPDALNNQDNHARYSRIRNIYAQGVEVRLVNSANDVAGDVAEDEVGNDAETGASDEDENVNSVAADHFTKPLPKESIKGLLNGPADISEVLQPYPSFGAKPAESLTALKVRASERLRHKQRALLSWDYERLVLSQFPELYLTRCFSTTGHDNTPPVALVVVPINHNPHILQPKVPLYLKRQIQRFVDEVSPEGVDVAVRDPVYEEVRVTVYAQIKPEFDKERIEVELNQMIIDSMTPWNKTDLNPDDGLRGNVELTFLAQQMEQHPALERVYVVRAKQSTESGAILYPNGGADSHAAQDKFIADNVITTRSPQSILVPAKVHDINLFNHYQPIFEGVGKWRLELDFKIR